MYKYGRMWDDPEDLERYERSLRKGESKKSADKAEIIERDDKFFLIVNGQEIAEVVPHDPVDTHNIKQMVGKILDKKTTQQIEQIYITEDE